ncbi:hypothetical protein MBLNU230_g0810t1 [Neophaeotheca triangularis]
MDKTIGVLGGGQLGSMLVENANNLRIKVNVLDAPGAPAKQVSNHDGHVDGSFKDPDSIRKLAAKSDVLTVEIEHVDTQILEQIANEGADVQPSWKTIRTIQDKYLQKEHLQKHDVATAQSMPLEEATTAELKRASQQLGLPFFLKSRKEAYDGKGNFPVKSEQDFSNALQALGGANRALYAEKWADFKMELAVMVVKTQDSSHSFPTVETIHENSICKLVYAPARGVSDDTNRQAQELARKAVSTFWGKGVFGVEMFLLKDDTLLINEIAPRPHNSGHYTIEACAVSQYDAHLRTITDRPIPSLAMRTSAAIMLNILGGNEPDSHLRVAHLADSLPNTTVHLYGKGQARPGRKMGHITITAPNMSTAQQTLQPLLNHVDSLPSTTQPPAPTPEIAILMGSDSDLPHLLPGIQLLEKFQIPYTTRITSAHRTPTHMAQYASAAASKGLKAIIAAAGGAAHLPGMVASHTTLPVVGVPIKPSIGDGMDSLLSMSNMPRGVPVATVGVNNSVNGALLAARILGAGDERVRAEVEAFVRRNEEEVLGKDGRLLEMGARGYAEKVFGKI